MVTILVNQYCNNCVNKNIGCIGDLQHTSDVEQKTAFSGHRLCMFRRPHSIFCFIGTTIFWKMFQCIPFHLHFCCSRTPTDALFTSLTYLQNQQPVNISHHDEFRLNIFPTHYINIYTHTHIQSVLSSFPFSIFSFNFWSVSSFAANFQLVSPAINTLYTCRVYIKECSDITRNRKTVLYFSHSFFYSFYLYTEVLIWWRIPKRCNGTRE